MDDGRVRRFLNSVMEEEELNDDEDDEDEVIEVDISALGTTSSPAHLITTQTISNQKNRDHANDSAKLTGLFSVNFAEITVGHRFTKKMRQPTTYLHSQSIYLSFYT